MNRPVPVLCLVLLTFLITCQKDSPYIPESYKLLPKSDIPIPYVFWHFASIPVSPAKDLTARAEITWTSPYEQVPIQEIWPFIETSPEVQNRVHVLDINFIPNGNITSPDSSWHGIMLYTPEEFRTQYDSFQQVEVTIKGNQGIVHFDVGEISEDAIPNHQLDSEDLPVYGMRNLILDPGEDVGLDGMAGKDPADWWDVNGNGTKDPDEPLSNDDFEFTAGGPIYSVMYKTEGNRKLDTEDLDLNDKLDTLNCYYEYSINLDKSSADTMLIVSDQILADNSAGWCTYRLDLTQPSQIVGDPALFKPNFFRIWIDGLNSPALIRIAAIDFK